LFLLSVTPRDARDIEIPAPAPARKIPRQQNNEGQPRPMPKSEWFEELLLGLLNGGGDGFNGGEWFHRLCSFGIGRDAAFKAAARFPGKT
jgi:hypothetical protein